MKSTFLGSRQREQLLSMKGRLEAIALHGHLNGSPASTEISRFIQGILDDETPDTERHELVRRARTDRDARDQLCALRIETTQNFVMATSHWLPWYEVVNLANDDQVEWVNETRYPVAVKAASQNGGIVSRGVIKPQQKTTLEMVGLVTDAVRYQLEDWQRGAVGSLAQKQFDLAFDLRAQLDSVLANFTSAGIADFTLTGSKVARTYVPHASIRSGVLPTTNALAIPSVGGATLFGFTTLDAILGYCAKWYGAFQDGDLRPTGEIIVPADQIIQIAATLNLAVAQSEIMDQIAKVGFMSVPYMGITWKFIPSNTTAKGYAWARLSKPIGKLYFKPGYAKSVVETNERENWEERWEQMVYALVMPETWRPNLIRVEFNTTHS